MTTPATQPTDGACVQTAPRLTVAATYKVYGDQVALAKQLLGTNYELVRAADWVSRLS